MTATIELSSDVEPYGTFPPAHLALPRPTLSRQWTPTLPCFVVVVLLFSSSGQCVQLSRIYSSDAGVAQHIYSIIFSSYIMTKVSYCSAESQPALHASFFS